MTSSAFTTLFHWLIPDPLVSILVRFILPDHQFMLPSDQSEEREARNLQAKKNYAKTLKISEHDERTYLSVPHEGSSQARHLISVHGNLSFAASILLGQFRESHHVHSMDYLYTELNQREGFVFSDQTVAQHVQDIKKFIKHLHDVEHIPYDQMDIIAHSLGSLMTIWALYELIKETPQPDDDSDHPTDITPISYGGFGYFATNIHPFLSEAVLREKFIAAGLLPPEDLLTMVKAIPNLLILSIHNDQIVPDVLSLRRDIESRDLDNALFGSTLRVHAPFELTIATDAHNCPITSTELPGMQSPTLVLLNAIFYNNPSYFEQSIEAHKRALTGSFASLSNDLQEALDRMTPAKILATITPGFIKKYPQDAVHLRHMRDTSYTLLKLIAIGKKYFPDDLPLEAPKLTHSEFATRQKDRSFIHYACYFLLPIAMLGGLIGAIPGTIFLGIFKSLSQIFKWIGEASVSETFDEIANTGSWVFQALGIGLITFIMLTPLIAGILGTIGCELLLIGSSYGASCLSSFVKVAYTVCGALLRATSRGISKATATTSTLESAPLPHVPPPVTVDIKHVPSPRIVHGPSALDLRLL